MDSGADIFNLVKEGDKRAFEMIFRDHFSHLCAYANTFVRDTEMSRDLVQESLFHIWQIREDLPSGTPVRAYLFTTVKNRCLNHLKHLKIKERYREYAVQEYTESGTGEQEIDNSELHDKIRHAIDKLPPERRKVFIMHRYDELKYREIAEKLGISVKTVENQIGKALVFLREEVKDYLPVILILIFQFVKNMLKG